MASIEGYVTVLESSDGGTGDPEKTLWQFFVDPGTAPRQAVTIKKRAARRNDAAGERTRTAAAAGSATKRSER